MGTSFARTVALQTGKMALLKGSKVPSAVSSMFTPDYTSGGIELRDCFKTIETSNGLVNIPTPFSSSCLNSVEITIIVFMALVYVTGVPLLISLLWKLYQTDYLCSYRA